MWHVKMRMLRWLRMSGSSHPLTQHRNWEGWKPGKYVSALFHMPFRWKIIIIENAMKYFRMVNTFISIYRHYPCFFCQLTYARWCVHPEVQVALVIVRVQHFAANILRRVTPGIPAQVCTIDLPLQYKSLRYVKWGIYMKINTLPIPLQYICTEVCDIRHTCIIQHCVL